MKSNPWGASFLTFSGTVLFIGIILVVANAMRERPVYADEPVRAQAAVVPVVEPAQVPVVLSAPVTVVERVVEKVVERIVYVPAPTKPVQKVSGSKVRGFGRAAAPDTPVSAPVTPPAPKSESCVTPRSCNVYGDTMVECQNGIYTSTPCPYGCLGDSCRAAPPVYKAPVYEPPRPVRPSSPSFTSAKGINWVVIKNDYPDLELRDEEGWEAYLNCAKRTVRFEGSLFRKSCVDDGYEKFCNQACAAIW